MSGKRAGGGVRPEDYFRVLVEQAADGIFVVDDEGQSAEVNASGHRLLGYEPGELLNRHMRDIVRAKDLPRLGATVSRVLGGEVLVEDWVLVRKDGALLEAEVTAQRLNSGALLAVVRDAGPRKRIEEKTRASEARLRSILETVPDVILTVDRAGTVLFINRTMPPLTLADVVGTSCFEYVPPDSRPRVAAAIEHVFSTQSIDEYEVQGPLGSMGERVWWSVWAGPLIDGDRVVAATLCATDITEARRDEARRQELFERLEKISSQVPGVVYQYKLRPDGTSCFPYASERIREIYRVSPEEVREDASCVFAIGHPDDFARTVESITTSALTMRPWQYEYRVKFPNGDIRWLYGNAIPEKQEDGAVLWHGFITDVTQRKEAESAKAHLEDQLRQSQKVESVGRLAGGVAHDFNNLLTSVLGFSEMALKDLPKESEAAANLGYAVEAAKRGAELTQQLLAFARKKIVKPEVVNLNEILQRMAPMIRRLVGEELDLVLSLSPDLASVKVDVGSLEQVIMNLVVNARDAISGRGRVTLETLALDLDAASSIGQPDTPPGRYVVLGVVDSGVGMTDEIRSRIFEPFFTTKPLGQGTGLGLAMCHGIVKQAGGNISVQSELGRGSSFRVYLPGVAAGTGPLHQAKMNAPSVAGHETLLLVEDEELILRVAREGLARLGYRVLGARDGVQALAIAAQTSEPIDLLITDVVMPRMGGRELASRLLTLRPGIKVSSTPGFAATPPRGARFFGGRAKFFCKPPTPTALGPCVGAGPHQRPSFDPTNAAPPNRPFPVGRWGARYSERREPRRVVHTLAGTGCGGAGAVAGAARLGCRRAGGDGTEGWTGREAMAGPARAGRGTGAGDRHM